MYKTILALTTATFLLGSLSAENPHDTPTNTKYLALGDSLPFGYNPLIQPPDLSKYVGYPLLVSAVTHDKVTNASCPGETSGSFAGTSNQYFPGFDCAALQAADKLFVPYNGAANQLDYAVRYLTQNHNTKLVTIGIGGNDLGLLQYNCTISSHGDPNLFALCATTGLPGVLGTYGQNLTLIFTRLRATGYTGPIIAVNYFAFNYADPLQVGAFTALNTVTKTVGAFFNVKIADTFTAFAIASTRTGGDTCKAGLLLKLPDGTCDTHPSLAGQSVIAATVVITSLLPGSH